MSAEWPSTNAKRAVTLCRRRPGRPRWTGTSPWESVYFSGNCTDQPSRTDRLTHACRNLTEKRPNEKVTSKKGAKAKEAAVPREFSKKSIVLDLLRRPKGATIAEIAKATNWQNHSIRGFISGSLGKKMGLTVSSVKREDGERVYTIAK
jgi:hypothetical protein